MCRAASRSGGTVWWTGPGPCLSGTKTMCPSCSGPAATSPTPERTSWLWRSSSGRTIPAAWSITRGCSTAGNLTASLTWRAGCTPRPGKFGSIWKTIPQSPLSSASICTTWAIPWGAWRATSAWGRSFPGIRGALSGTTWTRPCGARTATAGGCWATAATSASGRPTTPSAAMASSLPTGPKSPPCRRCGTGILLLRSGRGWMRPTGGRNRTCLCLQCR